VKLAQQKKELEELSENVRVDIIQLQERALSINEDIEASKALLAEIKGSVIIATAPNAKKV